MNDNSSNSLKNLLKVHHLESTYLLETHLKVYPNKVILKRFFEKREIKKPGLEPEVKQEHFGLKQMSVEDMVRRKEESERKSLIRSRSSIQDLVACNEWDYFVTLTFDPAKYPANDDEKRRKKLTKWIWYQTSKYGKFEYLAVPERHKSGAIHFHLLIQGYRGPLTPMTYPATAKRAGQRVLRGGRPVSRLDEWGKVGFSVVDPVGDTERLSSYVTKYITKDLDKGDHEINRRRYWHSTGLNKPIVRINPTVDEITEVGADYDRREVLYINEHCTVYDVPLQGQPGFSIRKEMADEKRLGSSEKYRRDVVGRAD